MSTLNQAGTLVAVCSALDAHFDAVSALGLRVHFHGDRRFVPPSSGAWVRVSYDRLNERKEFQRQVNDTEIGDEVIGSLDMLLLEHARNFTQRYRPSSARDLLMTKFPHTGLLPVTNNSAVQIGTLSIDGISERQVDDGMRSGLIQYAIDVSLRYLQAYTRSV